MQTKNTIQEQLQSVLESIGNFHPEIMLTALFLVLILLDLVLKKKSYKLLPYITLAGMLVTFGLVLNQFSEFSQPHPQFLFFRFLHLNQYEIAFKILFDLSALIFIWLLLISPYRKDYKSELRGEFYALLVALTLGLHLMVMASNLLMVYLAIEIVSIASYILTTFSLNKKGAEAGVKYLLFGAFSSGLMLYGMSLLYGFTGSLQFYEPDFLKYLGSGNTWMVTVAATLVLAGLLFKVAAVPFHLWAPDTYEGAPAPVAAFFSFAPKAAGIAVIINFLYPFFYNAPHAQFIDWKSILGGIAIITLTFGNLAALGQSNAKRLLAYSSIAHAGFLMLAVITFSQFGLRTVIFYLAVYLPMTFAAFALVEIFVDQAHSEDVSNFKGLGGKLPLAGIIFVLIMIALTGLPPTAGFNAKFLAFSALWEAYQASGEKILLWAFIAGLLNTVIALFYYLKIPYYLFFKKAENNIQIKLNAPANLFLVLMTMPLLVFFFKPDWLMDQIQKIILNF